MADKSAGEIGRKTGANLTVLALIAALVAVTPHCPDYFQAFLRSHLSDLFSRGSNYVCREG